MLPLLRRTAARAASARFAGTRLAALAALAALALLACGDAPDPLAPVRLTDPPAAFVAAPALLDVLADAESRVAPALDGALRAELVPALAELRSAVAAGQTRRSDAALGAVRALLADHARAAEDGDGADVAALGVVTDLVAAAIRPRPEDTP
jgi:hypothetical protein